MMTGMNQFTRRILFLLFFLSGFSSLAYQVVWTRMAFASFVIITPVLSVVLSVFMLGLSVGSWAGGRWISGLVRKTGCSAIVFYAFAELLIGVSAFAVPKLFALGEQVLLAAGQTDSFRYLSLSALVLAVAILPWCVCMGTTFPFMMAYIQEWDRDDTRSFSFLYLANVLGAMSGTFLTALVLVELLGFRHTLWLAAAGNFLIALTAGGLARGRRGMTTLSTLTETEPTLSGTISNLPSARRQRLIRWILFSTGFVAMAMEVVWTRAFTPVLKTQVYSFALIVFTYLGATFVGSWWYRRNLRDGSSCSTAKLMALLVVVVFLPILVNDHRFMKMDNLFSIHPAGAILLLASICPLCAVLGYLTPGLIDEYAAGHPAIAGKAYAINVLGCILGPLFASYVLLPCMSERFALILLGLPFLGFYFLVSKSLSVWQNEWAGRAAVVFLACALFVTEGYQNYISGLTTHMEARRDYAASVISLGVDMNKILLVNGIGMTRLTPVTKFMAHLPLAFHEGPPQSALIICFGMGTTYRSALSWNIDTTVVELVPSVPKAFGFFTRMQQRFLPIPKGGS
jgi:MFS family permease